MMFEGEIDFISGPSDYESEGRQFESVPHPDGTSYIDFYYCLC